MLNTVQAAGTSVLPRLGRQLRALQRDGKNTAPRRPVARVLGQRRRGFTRCLGPRLSRCSCRRRLSRPETRGKQGRASSAAITRGVPTESESPGATGRRMDLHRHICQRAGTIPAVGLWLSRLTAGTDERVSQTAFDHDTKTPSSKSPGFSETGPEGRVCITSTAAKHQHS